MTRPPRSALLIVFVVVFIDLLGFGIVLPVMPRLAEKYLGGLSETARGVVIGCLYSSFSLMQFIFSPVWGRLSDRIGRRPILILGLAGSVVFYALFGFAVSLPAESADLAVGLMMLSRIGAGIAGASVGTAAAVIADCTTPEKRARGMALIGAAFGIGFTFGPLIAYAGLKFFVAQAWVVGAIASGLSAVALVFAVFMLPETRPTGNAPPPARGVFRLGGTLAVLKSPAVGPLVLIYFLAIFGFANFEATLAMFTEAAFKLTDEDNFLVFAYVGLVLSVAQGGLYRPLAARRPETTLLALGVGLMFLGLGGLGAVAYGSYLVRDAGTAAGFKGMFYLALAVAVTGFAFVNPSVSALVSKRADPARQGEVLGVNQAAASLGRILGPFAGSVLFQLHPSRTLPYAAAGLAMVAVVFLLPVVTRAEKEAVARKT